MLCVYRELAEVSVEVGDAVAREGVVSIHARRVVQARITQTLVDVHFAPATDQDLVTMCVHVERMENICVLLHQ